MQISSFNAALALGLVACVWVPDAWAKRQPATYAPTASPTFSSPPTPGAIFQPAGYAPLTSGTRAAHEGDVITIVLLERTSASNTNSASTERGGSFGFTPPSTGPFSLFKSSDVSASGNQSFKGKGEIAQSNLLTGEVSVTVAAVYPNGTLLVRGEKQLTLNRGVERIQISGIVRISDISNDNRISSTRVADAKIAYIGKGEIARASRQGWLQRFFSKVSPF
jgi:flagellar L-ring protein FlgH